MTTNHHPNDGCTTGQPMPNRRRLAAAAAPSDAAGRWTAHRGPDGIWYIEDDTGRTVCGTNDSAVAAHIAANDPASVLASAAGSEDQP